MHIDETKLETALNAYMDAATQIFKKEYDASSAPVPLQTFHIFMAIPRKGTISQSQITAMFSSYSQAAISRNIALLCGDSKVRSDGGLKLAESLLDHNDRRTRLIQLVERGRALRNEMHAVGLSRFLKIVNAA